MPGDFDLVKEKVDIVQLIGESLPLRKAGRIYKALCPFHAEKTPSFTVDPERRTYKCFGCGAGGDVFTWLEQREGLTPAEALERLAERAGVEVRRSRPEERQAHARLLAAHEVAYFYFRQAFRGTAAGKSAADYLARRGLRPDTVERFGLGYAPNLRDGLLLYFRKKSYSDEEAVQSGLIIRTERGELLDRFRDRLIVPIRDARGRPIAFGGRAMRADQTPKYLNSPATPLFDKSATLYALDAARAAIRKAREAVVVEGYFDAIAAHQAGMENVVASMGTALTRQQHARLRDVAQERIVIAFDADPAGLQAAETRTTELLAVSGGTDFPAGKGTLTSRGPLLSVALLPEGQDPDVLIRASPDEFRRRVQDAQPIEDFVLDRLARRHDVASPAGRARYVDAALTVAAATGVDEANRLIARLATQTGLAPEGLFQQSREIRHRRTSGAAVGPAPPPAGKPRDTPERYVVAQLLRFPEQASRLDLPPEDLSDPELRTLFEWVRAGQTTERMPAELASAAAGLLAEVDEPASAEHLITSLDIAALRVREHGLRRRLDDARTALARRGTDPATTGQIERLTAELADVLAARERHTVLERSGTPAEG